MSSLPNTNMHSRYATTIKRTYSQAELQHSHSRSASTDVDRGANCSKNNIYKSRVRSKSFEYLNFKDPDYVNNIENERNYDLNSLRIYENYFNTTHNEYEWESIHACNEAALPAAED